MGSEFDQHGRSIKPIPMLFQPYAFLIGEEGMKFPVPVPARRGEE
jgi:hypothetical protein